MPYSNIEARRRVSRESQRRRRRRSGGIVKGGSTPDVNPVIYRNVNPAGDKVPLVEMAPWARRRAIRRATMVTMGLTREAYDRHLEDRVEALETLTDRLSEHIVQLTWQVADLQADAIEPGLDAEEQEAVDYMGTEEP